jgi:Domain of unknown function (DUF4412)
MKTSLIFRRLGGLCLAVLATVSTAFAFEGKVDMKMTNDGKEKDAVQMSYRIKDEKMRIDMGDVAIGSAKKKKKKEDDAQGAVIMDFKKKELIMLMPSEKMYMVRSLEEPKENAKKKKGDEEFKPTGRKETIAGVDAEEYVGKSDGRIVEVWVTKTMGKYMNQQGGKGAASWEAFMDKEGAFPLRMITRKKADGPEESRMETTAIDRSKQDASFFDPPSDYQKFEMPSVRDMMKGMIPGR